jgi:uncharacterized protein YukE
MARMGMDVDAVAAAAGQLRARAGQLEAFVTSMERTISSLHGRWHGPDLASFTNEWPAMRQMLAAAANSVDDLAERALHNVADQRQVSGAGAGGGGGGTAPNVAKGPGSTADLVSGLRDMPKGQLVNVQKVLGADGKVRFIVSIPGTFGDIWDLPNYNQVHGWGSNFNSWWNNETSAKNIIEASIRDAMAGYPDAEVMVIGHSQGGMIAESLADGGKFNITQVVTIGAPGIDPSNDFDGAGVLRIRHASDAVPGFDAVRVALDYQRLQPTAILGDTSSGGQMAYFVAGNPLESLTGNAHDLNNNDYNWVADQFDALSDPAFAPTKSTMSKFLGSTLLDESIDPGSN